MRGATLDGLDYPAAIQGQLAAVCECIVSRVYPLSLLLLGSAARGELAYFDWGGHTEVLSDYEFMIVTDSHVPARQKSELRAALDDLRLHFDSQNPLFHNDVTFRERDRLRNLPPLIFTYEMKCNGKLLYGDDLRHLMPQVTLESLDRRNTNEILYKRLWATLLYLPETILSGELSPLERQVAGYTLCRNALDLTTVLLPREGILLPTYRERVEQLERAYAKLTFAPYFGSDFPAFMRECLTRRLTLGFVQDELVPLYSQVIQALSKGLEAILPDSVGLSQLLHHSGGIYNERPVSRGEWYNLVRIVSGLARARGPGFALRWLARPKKGRLTLGLLLMHWALLAYLSGSTSQADSQLADSWTHLSYLGLVKPRPLSGSFAQQWLMLRQGWASFWSDYIRLGSTSQRRHVAGALSWRDPVAASQEAT
jgi:hypothetical protein